MSFRHVTAFVLGSSTAGCYSADFDPNIDGVFACQADADCSDGQTCMIGVCRSDEGPRLWIMGPEEDSTFTDDQPMVSFQLSVRGEALELDEPGSTHVEGKGYLVVEVDGTELASPVASGNLAGGVGPLIELDDPAPGLHRLRVRAMRLDGKPYLNPSATATTVFWIDDDLPHIGIRSPWPGDPHPAGVDLPVEVHCLNCAFIKPDLAGGEMIVDPIPEGHTHVFFDRREAVPGTLDLPACLPECNFDYAQNGSIKPTTDGYTSVVSAPVGQVPTDEGPLRLTSTLNFTSHTPYPFDNVDPTLWDQAPELREQLVWDSVQIEIVGP